MDEAGLDALFLKCNPIKSDCLPKASVESAISLGYYLLDRFQRKFLDPKKIPTVFYWLFPMSLNHSGWFCSFLQYAGKYI